MYEKHIYVKKNNLNNNLLYTSFFKHYSRPHNTCWRNMIHNKTEESLEQRPLSDLGGNSRNWGWDIWRGAWRKGWGEECSNILMVFAHITYIWWNLIFFSKNRGSEEVGPAPKTRFPTLRFYSGINNFVRHIFCWHLWRQNTAVLRAYTFYIAIYCTW